MTTYPDAGDYIAEELRQLERAIRAYQESCRQQFGRNLDFATAKREFLAQRFHEFAVAFRETNRVANASCVR